MARAPVLATLAAATVVLGSCAALGPPQLVRDEIGLFSAEARATAEDRLRELAAEAGVWAFVITDAEGDAPRMLEEPMSEAGAAGMPGVAVLFGPDGFAGVGLNERADESFSSLDVVAVDAAIQAGDADGALEAAVDAVVDRVASGVPAGSDGPPIPAEPT